jgi:acyl-coenzyme A synthetase/AMP-(fatty) acid ligase
LRRIAASEAPDALAVIPCRFPLLAHTAAADVVAWRDGAAISRARFLGDVHQLMSLLPAGRHVLNLCSDRYRFAVGLAAALLSGKISLLPPAQTPEMLRELQAFAPDLYCLCDDDTPVHGLPLLRYPFSLDPVDCDDAPPEIDGAQMVAWMFTSGSTGAPQRHAKCWGSLVSAGRAGARRMGLCEGAQHALVATVPPQHMFGFEVSVLLAWQSPAAFYAGRPFYPEDIRVALESLPPPRTLVTTPFHLHNWLAGAVDMPRVENIVSATAPLSQGLAQQAETRCGARVFEIYGSTETGQLASRLTAHEVEWQLYDGLQLTIEEDGAWVSGAHVAPRVRVHDRLQRVSAQGFLLHGRSGDLVNIAGKRSSLGYLNFQLNAIPGVQDGVYFVPGEEQADEVTRLTAFVVAPGLCAAELKQALRQRLDPLFLPRPLYFVTDLPRNESGKLTLAALRQLAARCAGAEANRNA